MYTSDVESITQKNEPILAIFCIILAWVYGKLPKIQKKCPDCEIHGLRLKDTLRSDLYLRFIRSLLLNDIYYFFSPDFFRRKTRHFARA